MKGVDANQLPSYLDEFMWRERYSRTAQKAFDKILDHIADCTLFKLNNFYNQLNNLSLDP